MFRSASLLSLVFAALAISANASPIAREPPTASLAFTRRFKLAGDLNIADHDRARAHFLKNRKSGSSHEKRQSSFDVTNVAEVYQASVGVGSPPTYYTLLIDTGSSNTWVGAGQSYVQTSTSQDTGDSVSVSYGSGSFSGEEWLDTVTLSSSLVITGQSIGVASQSQGFDGFDGILGIGPTDLTEQTVSGVNTVPTVSDNLYSQGKIPTEVVGVFYAPATSDSDTNGELTFGGTDSTKYTGSINYVSLTTTSPASEYWGINESITYGSTSIMPSTAGIVDTGTTLILLATSSYNTYKKQVGASLDETTGLLKISSSKYSSLQNLNFDIGGTTYSLTPNGQIWPRSLNSAIGGSSNEIYLVVNDIGSSLGQGLDFINGYTFLERFYSVFDTTHGRVGFAKTAYTTATTN